MKSIKSSWLAVHPMALDLDVVDVESVMNWVEENAPARVVALA